MVQRQIYITEADAAKLRELLRVQISKNRKDQANLRVLDAEVRRATLVRPGDVSPDVVTMHSRLLIENATTHETMECTLVFPDEADADTGRISVVAPIDAAVLGYRTGDTIRVEVPAGMQTLRIKSVLFQPEAVGVHG